MPNPTVPIIPEVSALTTQRASEPTNNRGPARKVAPNRRAYKINEAAEILGVTAITIRRLIDRGVIRPCRALRHVLVPADEIERLLKN